MAVRILHHVQTGCIASCLLLAPFILEGMGVGTPALVIPHVPLMNILHTIMIDVFLAGLLYRAAFIIVVASTRLPAAKAVSGHQRLVQYQQDACSSYMVAYPDGHNAKAFVRPCIPCLPSEAQLLEHSWLFCAGDHHYFQVCAVQQQQRASAIWAEEYQPGMAAGPRRQGALPLG